MSIKAKALLFGLNYAHCKSGKLNGCINDVYNISKYIKSFMNMPIDIYTDDTDLKNTSYDGIINKLYDLAIESYRENLDFVWIHYSGHGSYQKDVSGDEEDGYDEGLVPSDYETKGILIDDLINKIFNSFNPKTKVLFICDSCHSGSMLDLTYNWNKYKQSSVDNELCAVKAPTILISGCMDNQTSADAYNILRDNKYVGALSASILKVLAAKPQYIYDVFSFVEAVRKELLKGGFKQYPCLSSNFDLTQYASMIPVTRPSTTQQPVQQPIQQPVQQPMQQPMQQPQTSYPYKTYASSYPLYPPSAPSLARSRYYESNNTYMRNVNLQQPNVSNLSHHQLHQPIVVTYIPIQIVPVQQSYGYGVSI
jgi:hypothetical protein